MFKASYKSPPLGVLKKSLGSWQGQKIIAIGPKGGKIIGYSKGEPIYAGSAKAQKLVEHKAEAEKHVAHGPGAIEKLGAVIGEWLALLGIKAKATEGDLIALSADDAAEVKAQFGVSGKPMAGHFAVNAKELAAHVGKTFSPKVGEELATLAALAAGAFGDEAPWQPAQLAKMKVKGGAGGSHGHTFTVSDGKTDAIWKTDDTTIYHAEEAASRLAQLVFPKPSLYAKGAIVELSGKTGVLLSKVEGKTGVDSTDILGPESGHKVSDARLQKHAVRLIQHQVFGWLVDNHDTHAGNFIETPDGDLGAFDNGQAWRFMVEGKPETLSDTYNPNKKSEGLAAQQVWLRWKAGKVKLDEKEVVAAVEEVLGGIATLSAEQFEQIVAPYFAQKNPAKIKKAVERFQNMQSDWEKFLSTQFGHKVTLTPKVKGAVEATPALTVIEAPKPAKKPKAPKLTVPTAAPLPEPAKLVVQMPGWPKKKGNVTVHNPGGPPPPGTSWPAKYPGPGYIAVVAYKGQDFRFAFKIGADGKPAVVVEKKVGEGWGLTPIFIASSIQQAADIPFLHSKGLPLDMTSSEKKAKNIGYSAMKLFQIGEFAEDFKQVSTLAVSPASESVQELEAEKKIEPATKKLTHFEMLMSVGAQGVVSDSAMLPVEVQDFVKAAKVAELPADWDAPPPGTVWATPPGDLESGGTGSVNFALTTVQVDPFGDPAYTHWGVLPTGHVMLSASGTDGTEPLAQEFKNNPSLLAEAATMKKVAAPVGSAPVAVAATISAPKVGTKISDFEEFKALPVGATVETSYGEKFIHTGGGWWNDLQGGEHGPSELAALALAQGPFTVAKLPSNWQTMPESVKIEEPPNAPKFHPGPLASGTKITKQQKGLGEVHLVVNDDDTFTVDYPGEQGVVEAGGVSLVGKWTFGSLSAACDHVWVLSQGYPNAAAYKKAKGVNKVPSGGGWKFWGLKAAPTPAPKMAEVFPYDEGALAKEPAPAKFSGKTVWSESALKALPIGTKIAMLNEGVVSDKNYGNHTKTGPNEWVSAGGHVATSDLLSLHGGLTTDEQYAVVHEPVVTGLGTVVSPIVQGLQALYNGPPPVDVEAKHATPASTKPVPKVVTAIEDVPEGAQEFTNNTWKGIVAFAQKQLPGGKTPAHKSPLWPDWVPPPGLILEAELDGQKLYMTTSAGGYLNDGSPAATPQFTVWGAEGSSATQKASSNAKDTLGNAFFKWASVAGQAVAIDPTTQVFQLFHLENAAYPANSTYLDHSPPAADAVITTAPEDIPDSEKPKLVTKKLPLSDALASPTVLAKYGLNPASGGYPKITISSVKTNKWGEGQHYISINAAKSSKQNWSAVLKQVLADHGVLAQITAGPNVSDFGGAYAVVPAALLAAETPEIVTVEEAAQAAPEPVPEPWPPKGISPEGLALATAPAGVKLTYKGQTYLKVDDTFYEVDASGKMGVAFGAWHLQPYVSAGAGLTDPNGKVVKADTSGYATTPPSKSYAKISVEALEALAPGSVIETDTGFIYTKEPNGTWTEPTAGSNWNTGGFATVPLHVVSQPQTELKPQKFTEAQLGAFPSGTKLYAPAEQDTYVKSPNGLWSSSKHPSGLHLMQIAWDDLIPLGSEAQAAASALTASAVQPSLPKKLLKSSTKTLLKQQLQALPGGTKLTFANGSHLEKTSTGWSLNGQTSWGGYTTATFIKGQGSCSVTAPGMATPPVPTPKPKPPPKPPDPAIAAMQAAKLAEQIAKLAKAKEYAEWSKDHAKPTNLATLTSLSIFQNDKVALGGAPLKLYAHSEKGGFVLLGSPDYDALKKSVDNWKGFPPYEEVDSPLGKLLKFKQSALWKAFPQSGVIDGPDGKEYPHGTTFEQKQVPQGSKLEALAKEPGFHGEKPDTTPGATGDTATVKWKYGTVGEDEKKKAIASLAAHGITPSSVIIGGSNIITIVKKADLAEPLAFKTETVPTIPPQPPAFIVAPPPFSVGAQQQGSVAVVNEADLDTFDTIKPTILGHAVRTGGPGLWSGCQVKLQKVVDASGKEFVEIVGDLLGYKVGQAKSAPVKHASFYKKKYDDQTGKHTEVASDVLHAQTCAVATLSSGTRISVIHGSTSNDVLHGSCVIRVPAEQMASLRSEMVEALKAVGVSEDVAASTHDESAERVLIKSQLVRSYLGSKGWGQFTGGKYVIEDFHSADTPIEKLHDEAWLDQQLTLFKASDSVAKAQVKVTIGGAHSVVANDIPEEELLAKVRFVQSGQDLAVTMKDILTGTGQPSLKDRVLLGMSKPKGSAGSDLHAGGDGAMFRTVGMTSGGEPFGNCSGKGAAQTRMIAHPRVNLRADYRIHGGDFGYHSKGHTASGVSARKEALEDAAQHGGYNETLHEHGVGVEDFAGVWCQTEEVRQDAMAQAKKAGLTHVNTIPLEDFFFTSAETHKGIQGACKGLKAGALP